MKKFLFMSAVVLCVAMSSCGNSEAEVSNSDSVAVDTVIVDTVVADTVVVDTVAEYSL